MSLHICLSVHINQQGMQVKVSISKSLQDKQKTLGFKLCSHYLRNFRWQCYCWNLKCGTGWLMAVVPGRRGPVESSRCWPGFICTVINNILLLQHSLLWREIQIPVPLEHSTDTDSSAQSQQSPGLQLQWLQCSALLNEPNSDAETLQCYNSIGWVRNVWFLCQERSTLYCKSLQKLNQAK